MNTIAVTGVGTAVIDYIGVVAQYPPADSQIELETFSKQSGGNVATALVTLAKLGVPTAFMGKFGDDELGKFALADLTAKGVNLEYSKTQMAGSMGFAFVIVEAGTGRRTILWTGQGKSHLQKHELDAQTILSSRYLHLDHYSMDAAIAAARIARRGDVQIVLDAESMHPDIETLLPMVDILITCAEFARDYTGVNNPAASAQALYSATSAHTVAVTDGENGSFCHDQRGYHRQAAFASNVVDTTGCGDVYHGAFIYGLMHHWPLERTARFASAAAAINAGALGGQSGIPTLTEIEQFLLNAEELPATCAH